MVLRGKAASSFSVSAAGADAIGDAFALDVLTALHHPPGVALSVVELRPRPTQLFKMPSAEQQHQQASNGGGSERATAVVFDLRAEDQQESSAAASASELASLVRSLSQLLEVAVRTRNALRA